MEDDLDGSSLDALARGAVGVAPSRPSAPASSAKWTGGFSADIYKSLLDAATNGGAREKSELQRYLSAAQSSGQPRETWQFATNEPQQPTGDALDGAGLHNLVLQNVQQSPQPPAAPQRRGLTSGTIARSVATPQPAPAPVGNSASVRQIPGGAAADQYTQEVPETLRDKVSGAMKTGAETVAGLVAMPFGAISGLVEGIKNGYGTAQGAQNAQQHAGNVTRDLVQSWVPQSANPAVNQASERYSGTVGNVMNNLTPVAGLGPQMAAAATFAKPAWVQAKQATFNSTAAAKPAPQTMSPGMRSGGSAATTVDATLANASPALKSAYEQAKASGQPINPVAAENYAKAESLPVPVPMTEGQAAGNVRLISDEMNNRGRVPGSAEMFDKQNTALRDNLTALRESAAPDVFAVDHVENGRELIDAYKAKDAAVTAAVDAKYQALKDAAGGDLPIDASALYDGVRQRLGKELLTGDAPASQMAELQRLAESGSMTFEQYLALRRNLGKVARSAADGNTRTAAGMMIEELEKMPMTAETAQLKPLADAARAAAKERFDALKTDPAYKAAVEDRVAPDDFIQRFVIKGKKDDVALMRQNLADHPTAAQNIAAGTVNWLKRQAGIVNENGNFSQAGYNKALESIRPKLGDLVDPQTATHLSNLGDVANATIGQKRGTYVNNSNTTVSALAEQGANMLENGLNVKAAMAGIPIQPGTLGRNFLQKRQLKKQFDKTWNSGSGLTRLSDIGSQ